MVHEASAKQPPTANTRHCVASPLPVNELLNVIVEDAVASRAKIALTLEWFHEALSLGYLLICEEGC